MPDTTVRDGWAIGVAVYLKPFPPDSAGALHSEQCVVVTGRTAQEIEVALRQHDTIRSWQERVIAEEMSLRDQSADLASEADHA